MDIFLGRGYASEGSRALIRKGFTELGVRRVVASTMAVNLASRRVMEKAGLTLVHTVHRPWPDPIAGAEQGRGRVRAGSGGLGTAAPGAFVGGPPRRVRRREEPRSARAVRRAGRGAPEDDSDDRGDEHADRGPGGRNTTVMLV